MYSTINGIGGRGSLRPWYIVAHYTSGCTEGRGGGGIRGGKDGKENEG